MCVNDPSGELLLKLSCLRVEHIMCYNSISFEITTNKFKQYLLSRITMNPLAPENASEIRIYSWNKHLSY